MANNLADTSKKLQKKGPKLGLLDARLRRVASRESACEQLQKICEHEQASTRVIFASNSSKGQILRALIN